MADFLLWAGGDTVGENEKAARGGLLFQVVVAYFAALKPQSRRGKVRK